MAKEIILDQRQDVFYGCEAKKPDIRELTLLNGISFPSEQELLMLILGSGTREVPITKLSQNVLCAIDESNDETLIQNLTAVNGMGKNRALSVAASLEFGRRRNAFSTAVIGTPSDIVPYIRHFALHKREHFVCAILNGSREIQEIYVVSIGSASRTIVHPREVFAKAVTRHASAIICCHNHPSGPCYPSADDRSTTERLCRAAEYLGISFLDHIIFSADGYFSFREHGLLGDATPG